MFVSLYRYALFGVVARGRAFGVDCGSCFRRSLRFGGLLWLAVESGRGTFCFGGVSWALRRLNV